MPFVSKKKIEKIEQEIKELKEIFQKNEVETLRKKAQELENIKELLSHVKFRLKDIKLSEEGSYKTVKIFYQLPIIELLIDQNGNPNKNDFFYSSNSLGLLDLESMKKIQIFLEKLKK